MSGLRPRRSEEPPTTGQMPEAQAARIKAALHRDPAWTDLEATAARRRFSSRRRMIALCLTLTALIVAGAAWQRQLQPVLRAATLPEAAIERLARDVHDRAADEEGAARLVSPSRDEAVAWVREHTGLMLSLADRQGKPDAANFVLESVSAAPGDGLRAAVARYVVDGHRVTLVAAHESSVPETVRWSWAGRRIQWRTDAATGVTMLSWANSGQAYVLVSALPALGRQACLVCHADGRRAAVVAALAP